MMTLAQASAFFDRTEVRNPDNGEILFMGQMDPYDDSKRDAGAAYRRVLSVAPGTELPAHRGLHVLGQNWLAGHMEPDGLNELHREKYVLQPASPVRVYTLANYLAGGAFNSTWAGVEWFKDGKEIGESSDVLVQFNGYFAEGTALPPSGIVTRGNQVYLIRTVRPTASGFDVAVLMRLDYQVAVATLKRRTYSPSSGAYVDAADQPVASLLLRWQDLFRYTDPDPKRHRPGDDTLVVPAAPTVANADRVVAQGLLWQVLDVLAVEGTQVLHVRRV